RRPHQRCSDLVMTMRAVWRRQIPLPAWRRARRLGRPDAAMVDVQDESTGDKMVPRVGAYVVLIAAAICVVAAPALAARPSMMTPQGSPLHAGEFVVALNKSEIIQVDQPFSELLVGNPKIADVLALTDRTIYVLGHAIGTTNLTIYGPNKRLIAVV